MKKQALLFIQALLNSYSLLFFSQNSVLAVLLLVASFFNPAAGAAGLFSVCLALALVKTLGFAAETVQAGLYSFNALLLGIGFGTFFHVNAAFWLWLTAGCILTTILTVTLTYRLYHAALPALSLPFVLSFWVMLLAANGYSQLGLAPKESYMLNELAAGPYHEPRLLFAALDTYPLPYYLRLFFRAISAVFFQDSVAAGFVISVGIVIHSRISFSLLVLGFTTACLLNSLLQMYPEGLGHYHLGVNFMTASMALGSFFLIPSWRSYLCAVLIIPLLYVLIGAFTSLLAPYHLPVLSLPFCTLLIVAVYFLQLRVKTGALQLTRFQYYSPETNLYLFISGKERFTDLACLPIALPFLGSWTVSQGYNGAITHLLEWGQALDFIITDEDGRSYRQSGTLPEHYHCYNKPVLACADGVIEAVVNHVDDNAIGQVNTHQNWGNTIIIKHAEGLYSQVAHLKKHSAKVNPGDFVKQGELLALCGNSGRSPEPHLHFQMQATPYIGSKTLAYPFAGFKSELNGRTQLNTFAIPQEGSTVEAPETSASLRQAFDLQPGYAARINTTTTSEIWEVYTDTLNQTYLYSKETGATAYFVNNGSVFCFTNFYGSRNSLLYGFYLAAYKVLFVADERIAAADTYPLSMEGNRVGWWLHDLVSPFYRFIRRTYGSRATFSHQNVQLISQGNHISFGHETRFMSARIHITQNRIADFNIVLNGTETNAVWQAVNTY